MGYKICTIGTDILNYIYNRINIFVFIIQNNKCLYVENEPSTNSVEIPIG